jgi:hypothetical protein
VIVIDTGGALPLVTNSCAERLEVDRCSATTNENAPLPVPEPPNTSSHEAVLVAPHVQEADGTVTATVTGTEVPDAAIEVEAASACSVEQGSPSWVMVIDTGAAVPLATVIVAERGDGEVLLVAE